MAWHIPSGYCIYSKFAYGEVEAPLRLHRGEDCVEKFCNHIKEEARRLYHMFPEKPMDSLTNEQWKRYRKVSKCHICYKPFNDKDPKVRDHWHYTGSYRGPAHRSCSLRYRIPFYIPVVFYNLSGYDSHLFIKELGKESKDIGVIAKNKEDYITFSVNVMVDKYIDNEGNEKDKTIKLRFIDSFKFMVSSLDSLTNNLVHGGQKLFGFEGYSETQYELLIRKGSTPMSTCCPGINWKKPNFLHRKCSIAISTCLTSDMKITSMHRKFGMHSTSIIWENTMIYVSPLM